MFGAWCALGGAERLSGVLQSRVTLALAVAYLLFAFVITLTWYLPGMSQYVPHWLEEVIYPIDKVNLDVLRFAHFLALAVVTVYFVPRDWPPLKSWWALAADRLRAAFARNLLPGHVPVLCRAFRHGRDIRRASGCSSWPAH